MREVGRLKEDYGYKQRQVLGLVYRLIDKGNLDVDAKMVGLKFRCSYE